MILIRWTIWIALALYVLALCARPASRVRQWAWTLGCLFYLAHVAAAFHFYHHWSHAAAYQHTARRTAEVVGLDEGGGLYWNYAFTVLWLGDVVAMWIGWRWPRWAGAAVQGFLAFMAFNATVVFGTGAIRWLGLAATVLLGAIYWRRRQMA
jgi:hypothetical protein